MRKAEVYLNKVLAGILTEVSPKEYVFRYDDRYMSDASRPAISLTLDKNILVHRSDILFPFFSICFPGITIEVCWPHITTWMRRTTSVFSWQRQDVIPREP